MSAKTENEINFSPYIERIQYIGEFQQKIADLTPETPESDIDKIFESIPKEYFTNKIKFCNIFQAVISILFSRARKGRITLLFLNKMKDQIRQFFKDDEVHLIKISDPHIFIDEWFLENGFLHIETILNEAKFDLKLAQYFLPEIIEYNPSFFYEYLKIKHPNDFKNELFTSLNQNPHSSEINFTKEELNDIKIRRKNQIISILSGKCDFESYKSYDPIPLRCCLMSDDIDRFQSIVSQSNLSINSICPYSIYEPIYFPNAHIYENGRSLIEAAASFGSIKIFKFLFVNKAKLRQKEIFRRAIFGGNYDIFHMIENSLMNEIKVIQVNKKQYLKKKELKNQNKEKQQENEQENKQENKNENENENEKKSEQTNLSNEEIDEEDSNDETIGVLDESVSTNSEIKLMFQICMTYSIKYGRDEIMEYLLDNYGDLFDLEITVDSISERIVNFCLINFKETYFPLIIANPNEVDEYKNSYLMKVAQYNYTDLVHLFLKIPGIDVNYINMQNCRTAMCCAAEQHSLKSVEIILSNPLYKYTYEQSMDITPFINAAAHGYIDEIMLFINFKKKQDENLKNKKKKVKKINQNSFSKMIIEDMQNYIDNDDEYDDIYYYHEEECNENEEEEEEAKEEEEEEEEKENNFANFMKSKEIKLAFIKALIFNQGEAMKIIINNFPDLNYFDVASIKNVLIAGKKCCWVSLQVFFELIIERKVFRKDIFDIYIYLLQQISSFWTNAFTKKKFNQMIDDTIKKYNELNQ